MTDNPETVEQDSSTAQGPTAERVGQPDQRSEPAASEGAAGPVSGTPYETPEEMGTRIKELTADLQRLQAEYVNYKRRVDRDRELVVQNAKISILSALLPVLDDVDRARDHEELTGGFRAVAESLERIVAGEGLVKFGAKGDPFDPRIHEAFMHSHSPHVTTTTCDHIVQAGYQIGDRVVRPARVTVVDPAPAEPAAPEEAVQAQTEQPRSEQPRSEQPAPNRGDGQDGERAEG